MCCCSWQDWKELRSRNERRCRLCTGSEDSDLYKNINKQMVNIERVTSKFEINELKEMIEEHVAYTNSESGKEILDHFHRLSAEI